MAGGQKFDPSIFRPSTSWRIKGGNQNVRSSRFSRLSWSDYQETWRFNRLASIRVTRPTAREASRILLSSAQTVVHDKFNTLLMQWGQFMSHDTAKTTLQPSAQCATCDPVPSRCMPVRISPKDNNMASVFNLSFLRVWENVCTLKLHHSDVEIDATKQCKSSFERVRIGGCSLQWLLRTS